MLTYRIQENLFKMLASDSLEGFTDHLAAFFIDYDIKDFTIWTVSGSICQPSPLSGKGLRDTFDLYELGYNGSNSEKAVFPITVNYFEESFKIYDSIFFGNNKKIVMAVTLHSKKAAHKAKMVTNILDHLSVRALDLYMKDRRMDLYVDYQKKVDFVKRGAVIFKALDIESVISVSLSFFSDVFSADAVCAIHNGKFYGIGLEEDDIDSNITIGGMSLRQYMSGLDDTKFSEDTGYSIKFNIKNIFFVYEGNIGLQFALFNIIADEIPDKDFSSLVSGLVSIAVENAENHEQMTHFKVEETEMNRTIEILNKFVMRKIRLQLPEVEIFAMNSPARKAGGDFVEIKEVGDKIKFCIADVCGKGYQAAVFTVVLSSFFSNMDENGISVFIEHLNGFLLNKNFEDQFITGFFAQLDPKTGELEYIYCGHEPVALISNDGTTLLKSDNLPLGLMPEEYQVKRTTISKGSTMFAYTDGLLEYVDFDGLIKAVKEHKGSAQETAEHLYKTLVLDPETQKDDFTCILIKL